MIRLEDPGDRGGRLTVSMTPFDLISLLQGLGAAAGAFDRAIKDSADSPFWSDQMKALLKDARANIAELKAVEADREKALSAEAVK